MGEGDLERGNPPRGGGCSGGLGKTWILSAAQLRRRNRGIQVGVKEMMNRQNGQDLFRKKKVGGMDGWMDEWMISQTQFE